MSASSVFLALDAGGTFFKSALVLPSGEILGDSQRTSPVDSRGAADSVIEAYAGVLKDAFAYADASGLTIAAVGVSTPGPFDYDNCTSLMTHKFSAIRGINLGAVLAEILPRLRGVRLRFLSDSHAFILGERQRGAAQGHDAIVGVTIGTGIGFGCTVGGKLRDNGKGGPLLAIFKFPCGTGTLEDYVSRRGIIRLFCDRYPRGAGLDVVDIAELARKPEHIAGAREARSAFAEVGMRLGDTLSPVVADLSPTCLVVGGQISKAFDLFGPSLSDSLGTDARLLVTAAQNPDAAALIGAAGAASEYRA